MEYRLLEKTELWISPVKLNDVDLDACAKSAAKALDLNPDKIMVTDAIGDHLTLDILVPTVKAEQIVACKKRLLSEIGSVRGVEITEDTDVHSDGILGLISLGEQDGRELLKKSSSMGAQIADHIHKRCMVFATGQEVLGAQIRDTNTPFLMKALKDVGYNVFKGPTLDDKAQIITKAFLRAAENAYGLLITTGGIGAENKDQTLEALDRLDPQAIKPYILKFKKGQGRHHKDGVRIGIGVFEHTMIVCLPGPHDEVRLAWPVLKEGLQKRWHKEVLAEALADALREKFLDNDRYFGNH
jgi:molybdenum cofactor synthesis domain-containing protein